MDTSIIVSVVGATAYVLVESLRTVQIAVLRKDVKEVRESLRPRDPVITGPRSEDDEPDTQ